jgi:cell division protein DivIC
MSVSSVPLLSLRLKLCYGSSNWWKVDRRSDVHRLSWLTRTRVALLLAAVVAGYLLFAAAGDIFLTQRLNDDEDQLRTEITQLQERRERLVEIRDYLKTDAYVEGVARNVLGLVRPGESLVVVSSTKPPTPTPEQAKDEANRPWWERLYGQ